MDPQVFIDITLPQLRTRVEQYHDKGWRFVNLCASTLPNGIELLYSFSHGHDLENLRLEVTPADEVPAVSDLYLNAFVFENEAHELFGANIKGIAIDFKDHFYDLSIPTPMNPQAGIAYHTRQAGQGSSAASEGTSAQGGDQQ
jgi:hypothetical protein